MSEVASQHEDRGQRLTRDDWVQEGLQALTEGGEPAVRVDVIAKKLKISRGSFYWHFADRAEYLSAILQEWRQTTTTFIHEYLSNSTLTPAERLRYVITLATSGDRRIPGGLIEQAVAQWAIYNEEAARMLATVHQERLQYIGALLDEMKFRNGAVMADIVYSYLVGHNYLSKHVAFKPSAQREAALELLGLGRPTANRRATRSPLKRGRRATRKARDSD